MHLEKDSILLPRLVSNIIKKPYHAGFILFFINPDLI